MNDPITLDGCRVERWKDPETMEDSSEPPGDAKPGERRPPGEGNLYTSEVEGSELHAPALDIDIPAALVPSSTAGHHHLYLGVRCSWGDYVNLLRALNACGIIEAGYLEASIARGATSVRKPGVGKATATA